MGQIETRTLCHGNIAVCLKQHHGNWATRMCKPDDQLRKNIEGYLLVSDSLYNPDGDNVDKCYTAVRGMKTLELSVDAAHR